MIPRPDFLGNTRGSDSATRSLLRQAFNIVLRELTTAQQYLGEDQLGRRSACRTREAFATMRML